MNTPNFQRIMSELNKEVDDSREKELIYTLTMRMSQQILPSLLGFSEIKGDKGPSSEFDVFEQETEENDNIDECVEKTIEASYKYAKKMAELQKQLFQKDS